MPSRLLIIPVLFLAAVMGAWAWFHVAPPAPGEQWRFHVATRLDGWQFEEEPLSDAARDILATTNLVNGVFTAPDHPNVTVFAAEWRAEDGQAMNVVQHTPDICWVRSGWAPVQLGQPRHLQIQLEGRPVPFECRVFGSPGGGQRELVLWSTLVGGEVLEESGRWDVPSEGSDASVIGQARATQASRRMGVHQFLGNVLARRSATRDKQFVRFSVVVTPDWESALQRLQAFAPAWLRVTVRNKGS